MVDIVARHKHASKVRHRSDTDTSQGSQRCHDEEVVRHGHSAMSAHSTSSGGQVTDGSLNQLVAGDEDSRHERAVHPRPHESRPPQSGFDEFIEITIGSAEVDKRIESY